MPSFDYLALDPSGRERRGTVHAESQEDARRLLGRRRFYVVRIERGTPGSQSPSLLSRTSFFKPKLRTKQLTLFTRQLATLGQVTPLEEALRTISRQSEDQKAAQVLSNVHAGVVEGRRLSDAMAREGASFPSLYRAMVAAGEGSGTLPAILERLADLLERQAQVRGKVMTALTYPLVLALVATGVVIALMMFVVPKVVEQFDTIGQQLPLLTRVVIWISNFLTHRWWLLLLFLVGMGLLAWRASREPRFRLSFDRSLLRLPLLGRLIRDLHAARMARTLSTMVASRLPLLEGLTLTTMTIHNRALREGSAELVEAIRTGGSLSAALKRAGVFPPLLIYMVASGEAAGKLDIMLMRAADYLEREFDAFTSAMLSLLEPAIIILMGGVVALIVLSILLPILQLNTLAAG
jgi:general secretion pathway protein F